MESVSDMLRPLHFVFLFAAFAIAFAAATQEAPTDETGPQPDANANDLEADATYWGYGRPYYRYGGWGGYGGRGWGSGWGGWGGGYGGWGGRGYGGWGGRGYGGWGGRGYGGWGGGWGYWG